MLLTFLAPSFALAALVQLASATAPVLNSPPQLNLAISNHHKFQRRALPRVGRRVDRRASGDATVRCRGRYTFALCGDGTCTDMGAVATGTACVDNAITWDTPGATDSAPDTSSSNTVPTTDSPASEADITPSKANLAVQVKPSATEAPTFAAATPTAAPSETEDDDESCDADDFDDSDEDSSASSSATLSPVVAAVVKPSPAPTSTASPKPAPVPTTTAAALVVSVGVSIGGGSTGGSGGGDLITGGFATYYNQEGGYGACGKIHSDDDFIVAIQLARYGTGSNNAPDCGRKVSITNPANGKSVTATVADACPGCKNYNSLDLSIATFNALADPAIGTMPIDWKFIS
ncbi:hypothetical protein RQP46_000189 [Phenoliferia psychrophenolica]